MQALSSAPTAFCSVIPRKFQAARISTAAAPARVNRATSARPAVTCQAGKLIQGIQQLVSNTTNQRKRIPTIPGYHKDPADVLFEKFDADGDGEITVQELVDCLGKEGVRCPKNIAESLILGADRDGSGTIDKSEFPHLLVALAKLDLQVSQEAIPSAELKKQQK